jgi:hypothetical protein
MALVRAQQDGLTAASTLASLAGAVLLLAAFAATQLRGGQPLLPLRLVSSSRVMGANLTIVANAGAFGGTVVLSTLFMQRVLGLSALETGVALVPLALSAFAGGFLAPRLIERLGSARAVSLSLVAAAASLGWVAVLAGGGSGYWAALLPAYCVRLQLRHRRRSAHRRCRRRGARPRAGPCRRSVPDLHARGRGAGARDPRGRGRRPHRGGPASARASRPGSRSPQ